MRIFTLGLMAFISQAVAQDNALERIEVTAQKRPESIQHIPVSVTAVSAEQINQFSIEDVQSVASYAPNFTSTRSISGVSNYFIRGVGLDDFNLSSVPAIGIYIDDVAIHNPMLANFALHDIQRVEVLRGPQNALYGKNTTGGAVHFISNKAKNEYKNGYVKLSLGDHNQRFIDAASNLKLTEHLSTRLSGFDHNKDGEVKSTQFNNNTVFGNINRKGFKINLDGLVSDDWHLSASVYGGEQKQIAEIKSVLFVNDKGKTVLNNSKLNLSGSELLNPRNDIEAFGGYLKVSFDSSLFTFSSITSAELAETERMDDWGAQGLNASVYQSITYNSSDTAFYSQEFQWTSSLNSSTKWLAGISFNQSRGDLLQMAYIDPAGPGRPDDQVADAGIGPLFDRGAWVEDDNSSYSIYGQIGKPLTEQWNLTTAYRWTKQQFKPQVHSVGMMMDNLTSPFPLGSFGWYSVGNPGFDIFRDYAGFTVAKNFIDSQGGYPASANIERTFNEWGGKLALDFQATNDVLLYGSIARGFKMGAVNSNPTTAAYGSMLNRVVEPEALITYEFGVKSQWLDNALRVNGAIFYNNWRDYQFYLVYNPGNPVNLFATLVNLPKAKSKGAELEVHWLIDESTVLNLAIGWLDTKVVNGHLDTDGVPSNSVEAFQEQVVEGNRLTNSPEWNINATLSKSFNFQGNELNLALHYNFIDEHIHILAGKHSEKWQHNFSEPTVPLFGVSAKYQFGKQQQYQAIAWGRNITDEQYCLERAIIPGTDAETVRGCSQGQGRQIGVTFIYSFD